MTPPGITVSPTGGLTTSEAGGTATFTVKLNTQPTANVTIPLNSSNTAEGTASPASLVFTSANWNTAQTVTVSGVDDAVDDGNIAYTIVTGAAISGDTSYNGLNAADVSVTNTDNDTAGVSVSAISRNTTEAGGQGTFTVVLQSQPTATVTVNLASSNTAEGTVSPATLSFTAADWNTPKTATVSGVDDNVDDGDQAYTIQTSITSGDALYNAINPADVSVTNSDDDAAGVTVAPTSGLVTTEAGGTDTFTVVLNSQPTANVTVSVASSNTSEGTVGPATLAFTPTNWNSAQTVTVTGVDDSVDDDDQGYTIVTSVTSNDVQYAALDPADVSVTNQDNDGAGVSVSAISGNTTEAGSSATFTAKLSSQPTQDVTIALNSSNTAEGTVSPATLAFTPANWNTAQTVTVTGVNDNVDDGDVNYVIQLAVSSSDAKYNAQNPADVSVTNTDDDTAGVTITPRSGLATTEAGGSATFTVKLDSQPTQEVTVAFSSSNTAEGTVSPASLVFTAANWNTAQTVTVSGVDDAVDDGDQAYSIQTSVSSTDQIYAAVNAGSVSVTNTNNDTAGVTVAPTSGNTTETGGTATFTVKLNSQPTQNVTIALSSSDTTEGTVSPATLTFTPANWNTAQIATVSGQNDDVDDGDIAYTITPSTSSSDTKYNAITIGSINVTNKNDDTAGVTVSPISGNTTEAGGTATFTVKLNSQPTANVSFTLSSNDTTEGTLSPATLSFTPANWNTVRTVTVTGKDDNVDDGDIAYHITIGTASSSDVKYNGINPSGIDLFNIDNDGAGIVANLIGDGTTSSNRTSEAGAAVTVTVQLASQPTAAVTIPFSSNNTAEGTVSPASLSFTAANWNVPQTVVITGVDDDIDDDDVPYLLVLEPASSTDAKYNTMDAADLPLVNVDDDTAGVLVGPISGNTTEAGGSATFTVTLQSQPTADVAIPLSSNDTAEGTVSPASLSFTAADWNVPQTVTVTGVNDTVADGDVPYHIVLDAASSADEVYDLFKVDDIVLTNVDDDIAGVTVSAISGDTTEAGGTATFTVKLNSQPTNNVSIVLSSSDLSEGTVNPTVLTFTPANWNTPQTVTATGVSDTLVDGTVSYQIVFSSVTSIDANYNGAVVEAVAARNLDTTPRIYIPLLIR